MSSVGRVRRHRADPVDVQPAQGGQQVGPERGVRALAALQDDQHLGERLGDQVVGLAVAGTASGPGDGRRRRAGRRARRTRRRRRPGPRRSGRRPGARRASRRWPVLGRAGDGRLGHRVYNGALARMITLRSGPVARSSATRVMPGAAPVPPPQGASNETTGQEADEPAMSHAADTSAEPTPTRGAVTTGWESVGEALAHRSWTVVEQCRVVGRDLAERGVPARDALEELRSTTRLRCRPRAQLRRVRGHSSTAWADATLGYLNRLSCADPLTGLESQAHLLDARSRCPSEADLIMVAVAGAPARRLHRPRPAAVAAGRAVPGRLPVGPRRRPASAYAASWSSTPAGSDFGTRVALLARSAEGRGTGLGRAGPADRDESARPGRPRSTRDWPRASAQP